MTRTETFSHAETEWRPRSSDRWLAAGGIVGPIQLVLVFTILGVLRPDYSPVDQAISDLGIGENAVIFNTSTIVLGLLLVGLAIAFHRTLRPEVSRALRVASAAFLALVGLGFTVAGVFPETSPIHWLVGANAAFLGAPMGFLLAGVALVRRGGASRPWGVYSLVASLTTVVLIGLTFFVFSFYTWTSGSAPVGHLGGLMERLLVIEILAWYVAFGWRLFRLHAVDVGRHPEGRPSPA